MELCVPVERLIHWTQGKKFCHNVSLVRLDGVVTLFPCLKSHKLGVSVVDDAVTVKDINMYCRSN